MLPRQSKSNLHLAIYGNNSDNCDIRHCSIKDFKIFLHLPQYKMLSPVSQLPTHSRKLQLNMWCPNNTQIFEYRHA